MQKILFIATLLLIAWSNAIAQPQPRYIIRVVDARNFKEPTINLKNQDDAATFNADLARHKDREVNVYHYGAAPGMAYKVNYYQKENDAIVKHGFYAGTSENFDKAEYTWSKDTLVIHLFNANKADKTYRAYGWGSTNSLVIDK